MLYLLTNYFLDSTYSSKLLQGILATIMYMIILFAMNDFIGNSFLKNNLFTIAFVIIIDLTYFFINIKRTKKDLNKTLSVSNYDYTLNMSEDDIQVSHSDDSEN